MKTLELNKLDLVRESFSRSSGSAYIIFFDFRFFFSFFGIGSFFRACVLDVCMFSLPCFTALAWKKKICVTKLKSSHVTAVLPFSS